MKVKLVALLFVLGVQSALFGFFIDHHMAPEDEGFFAYVAERLHSGELLGKDIHQHHPGLGHMINQFAFKLFGVDLLSLRYPLLLASLLATAAVFVFLWPLGMSATFVGSLGFNALGVLQFLDPSPNWYGLFVFVAAGFLACSVNDSRRPVLLGILVGLATLIRQPTGAILGVASVWVLSQEGESKGRSAVVARVGQIFSLAVLVYYLLQVHIDLFSIGLVAIWPLGLVVGALRRPAPSNARALRLFGLLALGIGIGVLPVVIHQIHQRNLAAWWEDVWIRSRLLSKFDFRSGSSFLSLYRVAWLQAPYIDGPVAFFNTLYWVLLPTLFPAMGGLLWWRLKKNRDFDPTVPGLACFYSTICLLHHTLIYLYFVMGFVAVGLLLVAKARRWSIAWVGFLSLVAIGSHAGQPYTRPPAQLFSGKRIALVEAALPRCHLKVAHWEAELYQNLLKRIDLLPSGDKFLVLPNSPELYFFSGRPAPVPYVNAAVGLEDPQDYRFTAEGVRSKRWPLVIFHERDRHDTAAGAEILKLVEEHYVLEKKIERYRFYTPK